MKPNPKRRVRKPKPKKRYVLGLGQIIFENGGMAVALWSDTVKVELQRFEKLRGQRVTLVVEVE